MTSFLLKFFGIASISLLLFIDCEEYTNYKIEAEPLDNTLIKGVIKNFYTGENVPSANISVGHYNTTTDDSGLFRIFYELGVDENRNKPVPLHVSAWNYYDFDREIILAPNSSEINIKMYYAAPIITKHYRGDQFSQTGGFFRVIQAIIVDYQGISTLDSVNASLFIRNGDQVVEIHRNMKLIQQIDNVTAYYQNYDSPETFKDWELLDMFRIKVVDEDGYYDTASEANVDPYPLFEANLP
jgi:hypothetical protein